MEYKQGGNSVLLQSYGYDEASRLQAATFGTVSAAYGYEANSDLIKTVTFKNGGSTVMTTTKTYDNLNRLTLTATTKPGGTVLSSYGYRYNNLNQRERADLSDGSYWQYGYDSLGQVTSGSKRLSDNAEVAGEQFGYAFDNIGNRTSTTVNGRSAIYSPNALNQYVSRMVPGAVDVLGSAAADATVTVNNQATTRQGAHFHKAFPVNNSAGPVHQAVTVVGVKNNAGPNGEDAVTTESGKHVSAQDARELHL